MHAGMPKRNKTFRNIVPGFGSFLWRWAYIRTKAHISTWLVSEASYGIYVPRRHRKSRCAWCKEIQDGMLSSLP